jgi:hypothetical protein
MVFRIVKSVQYYILIISIFFIIGCKSYKKEITLAKNEVYTYVIPLKAEKALYDKIKYFDTVFLELGHTEKGYSIFIIPTKNINNEYFGYLKVTNSNRKILVDSKLYDLVFDSDVTLGSKIDLSKTQIIIKHESTKREDLENGLVVNKRSPIYDHAVLVNFDKEWNVVVEK